MKKFNISAVKMSTSLAQTENKNSAAASMFAICTLPQCGMAFRNVSGIIQHQDDHVPPGTRYECFHCGKWFMVLGDLMVHLITHAGVHLYSCSGCKEGFSSFMAARAHVQTHVADKTKRPKVQSRTSTGDVLYTCSVCGERLNMMSTFCSHMEKHDKEFKERQGNSQTESQNQTEEYNDSKSKAKIETGKSKSKTKAVGSKSITGTEKGVEVGNRGQQVQTAEQMNRIDIIYITNPPLQQDQTLQVPAQETHICKECGEKYNSSSELQTHVEIHKTKYPCSLCGNAFATLSERNSHLRAHLNDRVFRCSKCTMFFRDKPSLDEHMSHLEVLVSHQEQDEADLVQQGKPTEDMETEVSQVRVVENMSVQNNGTFKTEGDLNVDMNGDVPNAQKMQEDSLEHGEIERGNVPEPLTNGSTLVLKSHYKDVPQPHSPQALDFDMQENNGTDHNIETSKSMEYEASTEVQPVIAEMAVEPSDDGPHICVLCGAEFETWEDVDAHLKGHKVDKPHQKELMQSKGKTSSDNNRTLTGPGIPKRLLTGPAILRRRKVVSNAKENVPSVLSEVNTGKQREVIDNNVNDNAESEPIPTPDTHTDGVEVLRMGSNKCTLCSKKFHNSWNLYQHVRKHRGGAKRCTVCLKEFEHLWHLHQHMLAHTQQPAKCTVCAQKFRDKGTFWLHMQTHKSRICPFCHKVFQYPAAAEKHMIVHMRELQACHKCGKVFKYAVHLRKHMQVHIEAEVPVCHWCAICRREFDAKSNLLNHLRLDHGAKATQKPHADHLHKHMQIPEEAEASVCHKCSFCRREFDTKCDLLNHLTLFHVAKTTQTPHVCKFCNKAFSQSLKLIEHILEHSTVAGESTYKCPYCNRIFLLLSSMKQHIMNHVRLHCQYCRAKYRVLSNFNKHVASHTCSCCGLLFPKLSDLRKHLVESKEEERTDLVCSICNNMFQNCICIDGSVYVYATCGACVRGFLSISDLEIHLEGHGNC